MAGNILDDPARLKAEREAADRSYNDALSRLDRAIQRLPTDFPHPPPGPDEQQITPLNTLWKIVPAPRTGSLKHRLAAVVQRAVAPIFEQQQAFNSAVVDHINRSLPVARATRESVASTLTVLHDTIADLIRFQSLLVMFLQEITPYVDTRDRDVAGLLRGLSAAINTVADEVMRRSEALTARDVRREGALSDLQRQLAALRLQVGELAAGVRGDAGSR